MCLACLKNVFTLLHTEPVHLEALDLLFGKWSQMLA